MSTATSDPPRILIVEDEAPMRRFLRTFLAEAGYRFSEASTAEEALQLSADNPPDVILLDLGLPDMDGQDLLRKLRGWLDSPIIVLSVRDQDLQKITALNFGANDYLTKPFSPGELLARIRVALRNRGPKSLAHESPVFEAGDLKIDFAARQVFVRGQEIRLTPNEHRLLTILAQHADRMLTHQHLLDEIWGSKQAKNKQHLRVLMASLRRKIEANPGRPRHLLTEQGVGYRLLSN